MLDLRRRDCPVCASPRKAAVGKPRRIDRLFSSIDGVDVSAVEIVRCERCSLMYVEPVTGLFSLACDGLNCGLNMEAVMTKSV